MRMAKAAASRKVEDKNPDTKASTTPKIGQLEELKEKYGMNAAAIVKAVKEIL